MLYKTICLQIIQQRPEMYDQLLSNRILLPTLEHYAIQLRTSHQAWKDLLSQARPGSDPSQIASEAMEIALQEVEDRLPTELPQNDNDQLSLDEAMSFIRPLTPPA